MNYMDQMADYMLAMLQRSLVGIVYALEAKDKYSFCHSERVATMSYQFASCLDLQEHQKKLLVLTAQIHDIGKIGVPDTILLKSFSPTNEEWQTMKSHVRIGVDILSKTIDTEYDLTIAVSQMSLPIPEPLKEDISEMMRGILYHHEQWDGVGYPDGIAGAQIPLSSRIIAICDSVDAVCSDRPYRKAFNMEICKKKIAENSGIMYDPELVPEFMENQKAIVGNLYNKAL